MLISPSIFGAERLKLGVETLASKSTSGALTFFPNVCFLYAGHFIFPEGGFILTPGVLISTSGASRLALGRSMSNLVH